MNHQRTEFGWTCWTVRQRQHRPRNLRREGRPVALTARCCDHCAKGRSVSGGAVSSPAPAYIVGMRRTRWTAAYAAELPSDLLGSLAAYAARLNARSVSATTLVKATETCLAPRRADTFDQERSEVAGRTRGTAWASYHHARPWVRRQKLSRWLDRSATRFPSRGNARRPRD